MYNNTIHFFISQSIHQTKYEEDIEDTIVNISDNAQKAAWDVGTVVIKATTKAAVEVGQQLVLFFSIPFLPLPSFLFFPTSW